jgi:hypothetical protein
MLSSVNTANTVNTFSDCWGKKKKFKTKILDSNEFLFSIWNEKPDPSHAKSSRHTLHRF